MNAKLIVALDFDTDKAVLNLVDKLDSKQCALKVGSELFTHYGPSLVKELLSRHFRVFLDLKFHDIPNTVAKACKAAADLGVWMTNVHALGGLDMMKAAKNALLPYGTDRPILIAVTILTSAREHELKRVGIQNALLDEVRCLAKLAKEADLDGVVSSAHEVQFIRQECGPDFVTVTPGIRLSGNASDDQSRIMTPSQALKEGSHYLVIGRPITTASNPDEVIASLLSDMKNR